MIVSLSMLSIIIRLISVFKHLVFNMHIIIGNTMILNSVFIENPRSLQDSCRFVIRDALGARRLGEMARLPVPTIMKDFLLYKYD